MDAKNACSVAVKPLFSGGVYMLQLINLSSDPWSLAPFSDSDTLRNFYTKNGCDGIELILCGENFENKITADMVIGLHLVFYPEWICLWENDVPYMDNEFGSRDMWHGFYALKNRDELLNYYRHELEMAKKLGVKYVTYRMGDNALDEYFTLKPRRSHQQQLKSTCDFLNALFLDKDLGFDLLLENLWLGCMNLTDPADTAYALSHIRYPRTGLLLDTGHLLSTNPNLQTAEDGCRYIHSILDMHGDLAEKILGVHLHSSLGSTSLSRLPMPPPSREIDYLDRYAQTISHLQQIDRHSPFLSQELSALIQRISPKYLCHELYHGSDLDAWQTALQAQAASVSGKAGSSDPVEI